MTQQYENCTECRELHNTGEMELTDLSSIGQVPPRIYVCQTWPKKESPLSGPIGPEKKIIIFRLQGTGYRVQGAGYRVQGFCDLQLYIILAGFWLPV